MPEANTLAMFQQNFSQYLLAKAPGTTARLSLQPWLPAGHALHRTELGLSVYRNNVHSSLAAALAAQFPVVQRLVGKDFFAGLASDYVCSHPPTDPSLTFYGKDFADFIEQREDCRPVPYLADVTRLELADQHALHASDTPALAVSSLLALPPEQLADAVFLLHDSTTLLASRWPVQHIFEENLKAEPATIVLQDNTCEFLLVYRLGSEVQIVNLQEPAFHLLQALQAGLNLQTAWQQLQARCPLPDAELIPLLVYVLKLDIAVAVQTTPPDIPGEPA